MQQPSSSETMNQKQTDVRFYGVKIVVELKKVVKNRPTKRGVLGGGAGDGGRARMLVSPCSSRSSGRDRQRALASAVSLIRRTEKVGRPTSTFPAVAAAATATAEIDERGRSASRSPYSSGRARVRRRRTVHIVYRSVFII